MFYSSDTGTSARIHVTPLISTINGHNWNALSPAHGNSTAGYYLGSDNTMDANADFMVAGDAGGLSWITNPMSANPQGSNSQKLMSAYATRDYNTGWLHGDCRGTWLCQSDTADRNVQGHTLTKNGTITEASVNGSSEVKGYSGFSSSNYLAVASHGDWDEVGTGAAVLWCWAKYVSSDDGMLCGFGNTGNTIRFHLMAVSASGTDAASINLIDDGATAATSINSGDVEWDDGQWHNLCGVRVSSTERYL